MKRLKQCPSGTTGHWLSVTPWLTLLEGGWMVKVTHWPHQEAFHQLGGSLELGSWSSNPSPGCLNGFGSKGFPLEASEVYKLLHPKI